MFFGSKTPFCSSTPHYQKKEHYARVEEGEERKAEHELHMRGLVTDDEHRGEHGGGAAERRCGHEDLFGDAALAFLRCPLVADGEYNGGNADGDDQNKIDPGVNIHINPLSDQTKFYPMPGLSVNPSEKIENMF